MKWFNVSFLFASLAMAQGAEPVPPALLKEALRQLPGVQLLDPTIDLPGGYTVDEIKGFGYWPPWVVVDLDRDRRPDVVAAVVKRGAGETQFGVLAIHAQGPPQVHWIVPLAPKAINGVAAGKWGDRVVPLYCIECDTNPWFRWSGRRYEEELYPVGEHIAIATYETVKTLGVFERPSRSAKLVSKIEPCTKAKIVAVSGLSYETRWYLVEVLLAKPIRGWIPPSFVSYEDCSGPN